MNVRSKRMQGLFIVEVFVRGSYTQSGILFFTLRGDVSERLDRYLCNLTRKGKVAFLLLGLAASQQGGDTQHKSKQPWIVSRSGARGATK